MIHEISLFLVSKVCIARGQGLGILFARLISEWFMTRPSIGNSTGWCQPGKTVGRREGGVTRKLRAKRRRGLRVLENISTETIKEADVASAGNYFVNTYLSSEEADDSI